MRDIKDMAFSLRDEIIGWRREIHQHPEIGLETPVTSQFVASLLKGWGVQVKEGVGGFGVVGTIEGKKTPAQGQSGVREKVIALRADMDALPIQEETGVPYASKVPGRMHACGHDGHVAMLLGAARILSQLKNEFSGKVKFIFQPGEEGAGGARLMIQDGALDDPRPDLIFGAHLGVLWPVKSGQVGVKEGPIMAASDRFTVTVNGRGGHGATPHQTVDPVVIAAQIVMGLQTIISRNLDPLVSAVITVGIIQAGTAPNVIPETCTISGTVRYLDKAVGALIVKRIKEVAEGIAAAMGASATVDYSYGYPPVINHKEAVEFLSRSLSSFIGPENVVFVSQPIMGGEDMAYYLEEIPGAFFTLGSGSPDKGTTYPHHHPRFNIDEEVLPLGSAIFVKLCLDYLNG